MADAFSSFFRQRKPLPAHGSAQAEAGDIAPGPRRSVATARWRPALGIRCPSRPVPEPIRSGRAPAPHPGRMPGGVASACPSLLRWAAALARLLHFKEHVFLCVGRHQRRPVRTTIRMPWTCTAPAPFPLRPAARPGTLHRRSASRSGGQTTPRVGPLPGADRSPCGAIAKPPPEGNAEPVESALVHWANPSACTASPRSTSARKQGIPDPGQAGPWPAGQQPFGLPPCAGGSGSDLPGLWPRRPIVRVDGSAWPTARPRSSPV